MNRYPNIPVSKFQQSQYPNIPILHIDIPVSVTNIHPFLMYPNIILLYNYENKTTNILQGVSVQKFDKTGPSVIGCTADLLWHCSWPGRYTNMGFLLWACPGPQAIRGWKDIPTHFGYINTTTLPLALGHLGSPRENYFRSVRQNVRQAFNALPDILIPCQTFFSVDDRQFFPLLSDIFTALNPAGQSVRQCRSPLSDISRSLPDMSGLFREDWSRCGLLLLFGSEGLVGYTPGFPKFAGHVGNVQRRAPRSMDKMSSEEKMTKYLAKMSGEETFVCWSFLA